MGEEKRKVKTKPKNFNELLDELQEVRARKNKYAKRDEELSAQIKACLADDETVVTDKTTAKLVVSQRRVLDFVKVKAALGVKLFLSLATIPVTTLEKHLGKEEIDEATKEYTPVRTLRIEARANVDDIEEEEEEVPNRGPSLASTGRTVLLS